MAEQPSLKIALTQAQQLEVSAATGLLVKTLEIDAEAVAEEGTAMAHLPLPQHLTKETIARRDPEEFRVTPGGSLLP